MGISTNTILFYGFAEKEEGEWTVERDESLEDDEDYDEDEDQLYLLFCEKFQGVGLILGTHCSQSESLRYLAITSTEYTARRGYPTEIDPTTLVVQPDWEQKLHDCAKELGLNLEDKTPAWYLVSWWG